MLEQELLDMLHETIAAARNTSAREWLVLAAAAAGLYGLYIGLWLIF